MADYINNAKMYQVMTEYITKCRKEDVRATKEECEPDYPPIPNYIGECFLLIAERLALRNNFSAYTYIDEMKSDAVENCIMYIRNFKPEKSKNPFAYFTTFSVYAFIRRIEKEKRQMYIKHKNYQKLQTVEMMEHDTPTMAELNEISNDFIRSYEQKMLTKRKKAAKVAANTVTEHFVKEDTNG